MTRARSALIDPGSTPYYSLYGSLCMAGLPLW